MRVTRALVVVTCLLGGCCSAAAAPRASTTPSTAPITTNSPGSPAAPIALPVTMPQTSVCEAAIACCRAFVTAVAPGTTEALGVCEQIRQAADSPDGQTACRQMIDAWRQSLTTMGQPVPRECPAQ